MLNRICILGRLTRDPDLRYTKNNTPVCAFCVAVERDFSPNKGKTEKQTDFFDCVAWNQEGEFVNRYFRKGVMAGVSGRMQSREFEDKSGNTRRVWELIADMVYFGESKRSEATNWKADEPGPEAISGEYAELADISDEELPF